MWWCCCTSSRKIMIEDIHDIMDIKRAQKYGITIERYKRILALPNMTLSLMDIMYNNGYDFSDVSNDLQFFVHMQTFNEENDILDSIKEEEEEL
jgi:hypothetical protein